MFQINSYVKEHFRTATFEIIWESSPFLNNVLGCSSNTLTRRDLVNQVFHKMLQNFLEHLIHLSTEASLENNSFVSLCTIFRFVTTLLEKKIISNTSKIEVTRTSFICTYYSKNSLFSYAKDCISQLSVLQFP